MKDRSPSFSFQDFYNYVIGNHADLTYNLDKAPASKIKEMQQRKREKIKQFFALVLKEKSKSLAFRQALRGFGSRSLEDVLFGNHTDEIHESKYNIPSDKIIIEKFYSLNKKFPLFIPVVEDLLEEFKKLFKLNKLVSDFFETPFDEGAYSNAFKILVLFGGNKGNYSSFDSYLKTNNFLKKAQPIHDALLEPIPEEKIHLAEWRKFFQAPNAKKAVEIFGNAAAIEKQLGDRSPYSLGEAYEIAKTLIYSRTHENPPLAELCLQYKVPQKDFNEALDLVAREKKSDQLPNIIVDGGEVGHKGYILIKLPIGDLNAYVLGKLTQCCQSIDGKGCLFLKEAILSPKRALFVLLKSTKKNTDKEEKLSQDYLADSKINYKNYKIVGQSFVWLGTAGNLTFDSWENSNPERDDPVIVELLKEFSKKVIKAEGSTILRVTIGIGRKTPEFYKNDDYICIPELPTSRVIDYYRYYDSHEQSEIFRNEVKTQENTDRLKGIFKLKPETTEEKFWLDCIDAISVSTMITEKMEPLLARIEIEGLMEKFYRREAPEGMISDIKNSRERFYFICQALIVIDTVRFPEILITILKKSEDIGQYNSTWFDYLWEIPKFLDFINKSEQKAIINQKNISIFNSMCIQNPKEIANFIGIITIFQEQKLNSEMANEILDSLLAKKESMKIYFSSLKEIKKLIGALGDLKPAEKDRIKLILLKNAQRLRGSIDILEAQNVSINTTLKILETLCSDPEFDSKQSIAQCKKRIEKELEILTKAQLLDSNVTEQSSHVIVERARERIKSIAAGFFRERVDLPKIPKHETPISHRFRSFL